MRLELDRDFLFVMTRLLWVGPNSVANFEWSLAGSYVTGVRLAIAERGRFIAVLQ